MGKMILNGKEYVGGENWHKYSTSERVIGEWIDGKPLYQKTIYHGQSIPAGTDNFGISCGISNVVDKVIDLTVIAKMGTEYKLLPQPSSHILICRKNCSYSLFGSYHPPILTHNTGIF